MSPVERHPDRLIDRWRRFAQRWGLGCVQCGRRFFLKTDPVSRAEDDARRMVETLLRRVARHDEPRWDVVATQAVALVQGALAAAGRLLPAPTEVRIEYGVLWHSGDSDGIVLSADRLGSLDEAHRCGQERIGEYGITRYSVRRCEHRKYADGSTWVGPWVPVEPESAEREDCVACQAQRFHDRHQTAEELAAELAPLEEALRKAGPVRISTSEAPVVAEDKP